MPTYKKVDADVMKRPVKRASRGRPISPEQQALVRRIKSISDESVVFEAKLSGDEKPATVRQQLLRAAKLAGVEIAGASLGAYNDGSMIDVFPVSRGGDRVGQVTSACHSPRLGKNIGYAMVPIELADLGTELDVEIEGDRRDAVVVAMPFIDPKKETAKQQLAGRE